MSFAVVILTLKRLLRSIPGISGSEQFIRKQMLEVFSRSRKGARHPELKLIPGAEPLDGQKWEAAALRALKQNLLWV